MQKNWKKIMAIALSLVMLVANLIIALPQKVPQAADVGEATDIEYNTDARILTQNGLGKLQKYKQSLAGTKWIPLPSKTVMVPDELIYRVGNDSKSGLDKYIGKVGSQISIRDNVDVLELRNLIYNLPPFRSAKSVQASTDTNSALRDTSDYVRMYLLDNGLEAATPDEKKVITRLAATTVDEAKLKVSVGPFDSSNPVKISGEYAYYGPITFETNKRAMEGSVALLNVTDNGMVSVVDSHMSELEKGKVDLSQVYYLKVLNSQKIKNVTITLSLKTPVEKLGFFANNVFDATAGYCIVPYVEIQEESANVDVGSFGKMGTIRVRCTDVDSGEPIKGATFLVETAKDGAHRTAIETNEKGYASTPALPVGEYKVYQTKTIAGYEKSTADKFPIISADGITVDIAYTNQQFDSYASFRLLTEEGAALNGGSIGIYNEADQMVASGIVDNDGNYSVRLRAGSYYAKQLTAKEGYLTDNKAYPFQIKNNTDVITHTFTNAKIRGSVNVCFYDPSDNNLSLNSGYFVITDKDGTTLSGPYKMEAGNYTVNGLLTGTYYIKQTTPPTGFILNSSLHVFTITSNSRVDTVSIPNIKKKGAISLTALDEDGRFLPGVTFEIRNEKGVEVGNGITNENGQVVFSNLPVGTYQCVATQVPPMYVKNESVTTKTLMEEGQTAAGQHTYRFVRGTARIKKVDSSTLEGVPGAILSIRNAEDVEVSRVTTGTNGTVSVELKYGRYAIWEIDPGDNYTPIGKKQEFAIERNGETVDVLLDSAKITSDVIISVHRSTAVYHMIAGAKFSLFKEDGTVIPQYSALTSNSNGQITIKDLSYGKYYLRQIEAPFDCIPYKEDIPIFVSKNGEIIEVNVVNAVKTGSITLLYRDKISKEPIFGAEFTLFRVDNNEIIDAQYTNKSGIVFFTNVPYGEYYIKMTVAAPGYQLDTSIIGLTEKEKATSKEKETKIAKTIPFTIAGKMTVLAAEKPSTYIVINDDSPNISIGGGTSSGGNTGNGQIGDSDATVGNGGSGDTGGTGGNNGGSGNTGGTGGNNGGSGNTGGTGGNNGGSGDTGGTGGNNGGSGNTGGTGGNNGGSGNTGGTGGNNGGSGNTGGTGGNNGGSGNTGGTGGNNGGTGDNGIIVEGDKKPTIPNVDIPTPPINQEKPTIPNYPTIDVKPTTPPNMGNINNDLINSELTEDVLLSEENMDLPEEGEEISLSELDEQIEDEVEEAELSKENAGHQKDETTDPKGEDSTTIPKPDTGKEELQTSGASNPTVLPKTGTNQLEVQRFLIYAGTILVLGYTVWEFKPHKKKKEKV